MEVAFRKLPHLRKKLWRFEKLPMLSLAKTVICVLKKSGIWKTQHVPSVTRLSKNDHTHE